MRTSLIVVAILTTSSGCQSTMLREHTAQQANSITDLYYRQVMDNLALHAANPAALPYFSYPSTGQNAVQRSLAANYQLSADLITSAGALFNRYLFDKQSSQITGSSQNNETWNTATTNDPDKIQLMKFAYDKAFGAIDKKNDDLLRAILDYDASGGKKTGDPQGKVASDDPNTFIPGSDARQIAGVKAFHLNYYEKVYPGWFCVGKKHDVPRDACYVGRSGKIYAWVTPDKVPHLSNFTLAILDIATFQSPGRQQPIASFGTSILPK